MSGLLSSIRARVQREAEWRRHQQNFDELTRALPLRYLFLEVTRRCNLACVYCGSDCTPKGLPDELATPE